MSKINGQSREGEAFAAIVDRVTGHIADSLAECLPELNEAVKVGERQASWSTTVQVKAAKKGKFECTITSRVRAPRAPIEIDMHLNEDGQLSLGFDPALHSIEPEQPSAE